MTVQTVNVSTLKRVKNNVIGNLSAKSLLPRMSFCRHVRVHSFLLILLTLAQPCQSPQCTRSIRGCCGTTGQYPCRGCPCHHLPILWYAIIVADGSFIYQLPFSLLPLLGSPQARHTYYTPTHTRPSSMLSHVLIPLNPQRLRQRNPYYEIQYH
jgi:hypothetical protein